jgi:nucleoid DNA-binding protein
MANVKKTIELDVVKNNNEKSDQFGKYYGRIHAVEALNLRGLVEHIMTHGTPYTRDVVTGVVIRLRDCIVELISEGQPVKLDGLGTFKPTLQNKKNGAATADEWNVQEHAEAIHIRFIPEGEKLDRLTSKAFLSQCELEKKYEVSYTTEEKGGKTYRKAHFTPFEKTEV